MERIEVSNGEIINKKSNNKKHSSGFKVLLLVIISFALGFGAMYYYSTINPKIITKNKTISETKVTDEAMEDAIDKIFDAVLCIEVMDPYGNVTSTGTGFVYEKDKNYGYVLTNSHVVYGADKIQATLSNDKVVELTLLGNDTYTDLAVLKMDVKEVLKVASIGTSVNTKVGNTVFAVGSPMGSAYAGTITKGILSGKERLIETSSTYDNDSYIVKVLQTDAAISPGNSGGPLVNLAGDVIGIASLKLVDEQVEGMGFAIPIEDAMSYVDLLKEGKAIQRPVMGVQILDLTNPYMLYRYGFKIDSNVDEGILLVKLNDNYPASNAGLKAGDIITKINGEKVNTTAKFKYELYKYSLDETIEVTYFRNGKEKKVKVKLDKAG